MKNVQTTLPVGTIIRGRYLIQGLLGKSGSGAVYLVIDRRDKHNLFALKEVILLEKKEQRRFARESVPLKGLHHPALPHVYDVFIDDSRDRAYLLMNYIEGTSLEALQQQQPKKCFSLPQVITMMAPIIDVVTYLHSQHPRIIHGDIKPASIILPKSGDETMLVDFGIAKDYATDIVTGAVRHSTPGYGAPEQSSGGTSPRTDIYALGATLYTLLTGTVPADALYRLTQLDERKPDPLMPVNRIVPTVPMAVARAIHRALSINSNNRFSTVEQFWRVLNASPKAQQLPPLQVTAKDYKALNDKPTVQQAPAPIVVPSVPSGPPVIPQQAVARPVAPSEPKQSQVPRFRKSGTLWPIVRKQQGVVRPASVPKQPSAPRSRKLGTLRSVVRKQVITKSAPVPKQPSAPRSGKLGTLRSVVRKQVITKSASVPKQPSVPRSRKLGTLWSVVHKQIVAKPATAPVPKQPSAPRFRKLGVLLPILLALLIGISAGTIFWSLSFHGLGFGAPTTALLHKVTPLSSSRPTVASTPTPSSTPSVNAGGSYNGTIYSIAANVTTKMSLTEFQQSQGNISGYFTGLHMNGSFRGNIDTSRRLQFMVTDSAEDVTLSFEGGVQSDGTLSGSYCSLNQNRQCAGDYGIWSVAPASS